MGAFRGALGWSGSRTRNVIGGNERRTVEDFGGAEDIEEPPRITSDSMSCWRNVLEFVFVFWSVDDPGCVKTRALLRFSW
jgi:hypothetical protein